MKTRWKMIPEDLHRNSVVAQVDPEPLAGELGVSSDTEVKAK